MFASPPGNTPVRCWHCERRFSAERIESDGILRSRRASAGGPYRILPCPQCSRENLCERTRRGRWFASPNIRVSVFEYFFSQVLDTRPQDFLAAAAWLRDNEERRRYFFERDGDHRYSASWLGRLWRQVPGEPQRERAKTKTRTETDTGAETRAGAREGTTPGGERPSAPPPPRRGPSVVSPHEILGVPPDADERSIRAAFRRLAKQYHPDKVHHLGEDYQRIAHEKFLALKAAYEKITSQR